MSQKFYITTAIAYANAAPHIGHAYEAFLTDVIARYNRQRGFDVFFLTGTDEHGMKNARAAEKIGMTAQEFVDKNAQGFKDFYASLEISNDEFIRTTDQQKHWIGAQALWKKLAEAGDIYKSKYTGLYCVGCDSYVTEKDLVDGKCPNHGVAPEKIEEENYFFKLSKYAEQVKDLIEKDEVKVIPETRKNEILALFSDGIQDVSFSRPKDKNPWGIPVPGDDAQVMYVWCDALANYISALGYGDKDDSNFTKFWPADLHVIGKDILRFHALFWPAMLLSAGLTVPKSILAHGFITSEGKKMSKSIGNVIDPKEYMDNYSVEALRAYFGREIPPFDDGDFTAEKFLESYNSNLANGIGNLVSRTIKMSETYFEGKVTHTHDYLVSDTQGSRVYELAPFIEEEILPKYYEQMDVYEINRGMETIWKLVKRLDMYVTENEPYKLIKTDRERTEAILWNLLFGISTIAELVAPFMPETSKKIAELLGASTDKKTFSVGHVENPLFLRR